MAIADAPRVAADPRAALAAEWQAANPQTPAEVRAFYEHSQALADDLAAWHALPARQAWTDAVVHVARSYTEQRARPLTVVDIGCGAGHDLSAVLAALPDTQAYGVEPNWRLRHVLPCAAVGDVSHAPIGQADILLCLDVLEHVPNPEAFLAGIAERAPLGALLIEATATHDATTPLHLAANRGWHPGHALELAGWQCIDQSDTRLRVWQRTQQAATAQAGLLLCAYRTVSVPTVRSLLALQAAGWPGSRVRIRNGDALVDRARSIAASRWYMETADDVFVMVDDDIVFEPVDVFNLVQACRDGFDLICGAYPVRNGGHFALRAKAEARTLTLGPDEPPVEIEYPATGFLAVHRRVLDALVPTLPLCSANQPWAFWPMFGTFVEENALAGGFDHLSEDFAFGRRARDAGFRCWLDPSIMLGHLAEVEISSRNMDGIAAALGVNRGG